MYPYFQLYNAYRFIFILQEGNCKQCVSVIANVCPSIPLQNVPFKYLSDTEVFFYVRYTFNSLLYILYFLSQVSCRRGVA